MKKSFILTNIFALFLTSCSSFKSAERIPAAANLPCQEIIKEFFIDKKSDVMATELKKYLKMDLNAEEVGTFFKEFSDADAKLTDRQVETFRAIFLYGKEDAKIRQELLKEFSSQMNGTPVDETNKTWEKFAAHKKKVDAKKEKLIANEKTEAGKAAAVEKGAIYEKLYYSCKTQIKGKPTPVDLKYAKRLTYALTAGGLGSSIISYNVVHWDEEKNQKYFNELYFTLGIGVVLSFIGGKLVLANPNLNPWTGKMPMAFLSNAISDAGVSGIYAFMFKTKDTILEKKLQDLESDPEANKKLHELMVIAEENHLFEKHLKNTQDMFKDKNTDQSMNPAEFDHVATMDDIDLDESRELLMSALAEQEYQEKSGVMKTGYAAVDRFTFHRIFNLMSVPSNIGLTILMHNQMCMSEDPKKGFMKAVGLYMGASILMDAMYFKSKKELINQ
ncbi:MAG: hypothetical protein H7336_02265 [Bacteriovorax sp.]|nr:hypothetical protein [Bacteriovorax sp.]